MGATMNIMEVAEIHRHRDNLPHISVFYHVYVFTYACNQIMESVQIILIDKTLIIRIAWIIEIN